MALDKLLELDNYKYLVDISYTRNANDASKIDITVKNLSNEEIHFQLQFQTESENTFDIDSQLGTNPIQ